MMKEQYPISRIISELELDNLLPAIVFRTARKQCDADLESLERVRGCLLSEAAQARITREVQSVIEKYSLQEDVIFNHVQYSALIKVGVGAHHAGQLLAWRLLLEELMSRGALRLLVATGTVAAGVDFPARTVVITAHSRRGTEGFSFITSAEFMQMAGRAGRRGKDTVGICLVAPSPYSDARVVHEIAQRPPEPLRSVYFASPSTVLNLLKYRNVDDLRFTVGRSLAAFLDKKAANEVRKEALHHHLDFPDDLREEAKKRHEKKYRRLLREAEELENKQMRSLELSLDGLAKLGFIDGGGLSEKGVWAAELCTSLVLELAEAIHEHLFYDLGVEQVVGLVASIAGDPHRPYFNLRENPIEKKYFKEMQRVLDRVKAAYLNPQASEVAVVPDAATTVIAWMHTESWSEFSSLLRLAQVAEGDVARLVSQTADHLNQISRLGESHPELAKAAIEGRKRILRPPLSEHFAID